LNKSFAMHFVDALRIGLLALMMVGAATGACASDAAPVAVAADPAPSHAQVQAAAEQVRADPALGGSKKIQSLRFKTKNDDKPPKKSDPFNMDWLKQAWAWLADTARVVMWSLAAVVVALFAVGLRRWVRVRSAAGLVRRAPLPSHVRDLDIRPESLPADIGAAAAQLWQRGAHRQALSLLYRGALSSLVHRHAVPIAAASTEGECVQLASQRLAAAPSAFFASLVTVWQRAVYGGRLPDDHQLLALCQDFGLHLQAGEPKAQP
jgi:Domain of unknown function (DUF4129)